MCCTHTHTQAARKTRPTTTHPHSSGQSHDMSHNSHVIALWSCRYYIGKSPNTSSGSCDDEDTPSTEKGSCRPQAATAQSTQEQRKRVAAHSLQRTADKRERRGRKVSTRDTRAERGRVERDQNGHTRKKQTKVAVVREEGVGGGVREMRTPQEDRQVKTQLALETQKQQLSSRNTEVEISSFSFNMLCHCVFMCRRSWRRRGREDARLKRQLVDSLNTCAPSSPSWRVSHGNERLAVVRATKLGEELQTERERGVVSEEEGRKVQELLAAAQSELEAVREKGKEREKVLRELEEEGRRREDRHAAEKAKLVCVRVCVCVCVCIEPCTCVHCVMCVCWYSWIECKQQTLPQLTT